MKKILFCLGLFLGAAIVAFSSLGTPKVPPKIYDCFLFYNELDLLRIRLEEMGPFVDKFVLVEAEETFRGTPKALCFQENQALFADFKDKIIHVVIPGHYEAKKPMHRERFQRSQIIRGLKGAAKDDVILISDVDEVVRGVDIAKIVEPLISKKAPAVVCYQKMYTYFLNRYIGPWPGSVAITYRELCKNYASNPTLVRHKRTKFKTAFHDVGWHFSYMGGLEQVMKKVSAFSHPEVDTPAHHVAYAKAVECSKEPQPLDGSFPRYVIEHESSLRSKGFIE